MRFKIIYIVLLLTISCKKESKSFQNNSDSNISLRWSKYYELDNVNKAKNGLFWCYSYLGATTLNNTLVTINGNILKIDVNKIGFNSEAIKYLMILHKKLKLTEEYQEHESIDIGRYISLLIGAPEHYYKFTEIPQELNTLLSKYSLHETQGYINHSSISLTHRRIKFSNKAGLNQLLLSEEIDTSTGKVIEFETMEIMSNGQIKFALFDKNGNRKNNADPMITNAGKPAKCIWCHESQIQPLFKTQDDFTGFMTYDELNDSLNYFQNQLFQKQIKFDNGINFNNKTEHQDMELVYISFMEPSAQRLSLEWEIPLHEVLDKLKNIKTHKHEEFDWLGDLYNREEIEVFAPYKSLSVSSSIREKSLIEVNYLD